jgi:hypothetical protein
MALGGRKLRVPLIRFSIAKLSRSGAGVAEISFCASKCPLRPHLNARRCSGATVAQLSTAPLPWRGVGVHTFGWKFHLKERLVAAGPRLPAQAREQASVLSQR